MIANELLTQIDMKKCAQFVDNMKLHWQTCGCLSTVAPNCFHNKVHVGDRFHQGIDCYAAL